MSLYSEQDKKEMLKDVAFINAEKDKLVPKWEQTGLLEGITELQDRRNMAQMLQNQMNWLIGQTEQYKDASVPSIMKEHYIEKLNPIMLPLVRKVFGPNISRYGAMALPGGLDDVGQTIVAKIMNMDLKLPHISTAVSNELDYINELAEKIRDWFDDEIQKTEKRVGKPLKFYIYMPIILGTIRNIEDLTPSHFGASTRFAVRAISDD